MTICYDRFNAVNGYPLHTAKRSVVDGRRLVGPSQRESTYRSRRSLVALAPRYSVKLKVVTVSFSTRGPCFRKSVFAALSQFALKPVQVRLNTLIVVGQCLTWVDVGKQGE